MPPRSRTRSRPSARRPRWPGEQQRTSPRARRSGGPLRRRSCRKRRPTTSARPILALRRSGPATGRSSGAPIVRGGLGARPFFLDYGGELLAPPPPAFGSAQYLAALAEIRNFSDTRTPEQLAIARKWVPFSGRSSTWLATDLIVQVPPLRARRRAHPRVREHGGLRRDHRVLLDEVPLLVHPPVAGRPGDHDAGRAAEPPVVSVGPLVRNRGVPGRPRHGIPERARHAGRTGR